MNYQVVADESVDFRIVVELRNIGITVYSIAEEIPSITDKSVLSLAFGSTWCVLNFFDCPKSH